MKLVQWKYLLVIISSTIMIFTSAFDLEEGDICTTPSGETGICVNIHDCFYAYILLVFKQKPETCGFEELTPIVCCLEIQRPSSQRQAETSDIKANQKIAGISKKGTTPCNLSSGMLGECISVLNCSFALYLLQQNKIPEVCGFEGNDPLVCCPVAYSIGGANEQEESTKPGDLSLLKCEEFYPDFSITVFGGEPSDAKEFPHMALIGYGKKTAIDWLCGGSLISKNFVLTAAHCLHSPIHGPAKYVRMGDLDLSTDTDEADPQDFTVKRRIAHPDFKPPSKYNDIALIELDRPIKQTLFVSMACLDTVREHHEPVMRATGWGKTSFQGVSSNILLKADVRISSHGACRSAYNATSKRILPNGIMDDLMICAGDNKQDTCQGDSGGPLQIKNKDRKSKIKIYNIVGVTSFGKVCGISNAPGVYTRVYSYLNWIEKTVWPTSPQK